MTSESVEEFRKAERQLDLALQRDEEQILAHGFTITDRSARTYHYKNETLVWQFAFTIKRSRGFEFDKVTVSICLTVMEPNLVEMAMVAEIFQSGEDSRWVHREQDASTCDRVVAMGIAALIFPLIETGQRLAGAIR